MCTWSRNSQDPLLRRFLDTYGLNLLSSPRYGINVASLVISKKKQSAITSFDGMLDTALPDRLPIHRDEPLADCRGLVSDAVGADAGIAVCDGFLGALGVPDIAQQLSLKGHGARALTMQFAFAQPTRDAIDPTFLGGLLRQRHLDREHPVFDPDAAYYVITGVAKSRSIDIAFSSAGETGAGAAAKLFALGDLSSSVTVSKTGETHLSFAGEAAIAFGLELFKLDVAEGTGRLKLSLPDRAVKVRGQETGRAGLERFRAFIGGESPFIGLDPA